VLACVNDEGGGSSLETDDNVSRSSAELSQYSETYDFFNVFMPLIRPKDLSLLASAEEEKSPPPGLRRRETVTFGRIQPRSN